MVDQFLDLLPTMGVIIVGLSSLLLLISSNWRWSISSLALQYFGVFILIIGEWLLPMALSIVLAGWIASFVLFSAIAGLFREVESVDDETVTVFQLFDSTKNTPTSARLFRLIAAGVVGLAIASLVSEVTEWVPGIRIEQSLGALILIGLGLLHLGWTANPFRVILGLLTVLAGFEIFYSVVEVSALVAGLLAGVTLGLSLVGAYMIIAPSMESIH